MATFVDPSQGSATTNPVGAGQGSLSWLFDPLNLYVVDPLTSLVTNRIALPLLSKTYSLLGKVTVKIVGVINPATAAKMEENLNDPLSTASLLKIADYLQNVSLQWGKRSPTNYPGIHYLDICSIIAARHTYIFASDAKAILGAPALLRNLADQICIAAEEEMVQPPVPSGGKRRRPRSEGPSVFLQNWEKERPELLGTHAKKPLQAATGAGFALNKLRQNACELINAREKEVRQKIVKEAAYRTCKTFIASTTRAASKAGIAFVCHLIVGGSSVLLTPSLSDMTQTASFGLNSVGACLFMQCPKTVNDFYNCRMLDVRTSKLREYAICVGQENISHIIQTAKVQFGPHAIKSVLDKFSQRVATYRIDIAFEDGVQPFLQTTAQRALFNAHVSEVP
jgi:hypothetical protein